MLVGNSNKLSIQIKLLNLYSLANLFNIKFLSFLPFPVNTCTKIFMPALYPDIISVDLSPIIIEFFKSTLKFNAASRIILGFGFLQLSGERFLDGLFPFAKIASILFKGNAVGASGLEFTSKTELVDKDDIQINIRSRGQGNIDVIQQ